MSYSLSSTTNHYQSLSVIPSSSGVSSGLLGAMSQLKKASNPDLADERQYEEREEFTSPILKPRRGAVQKKVREREERKKLDERIIEKRL